MQPKLHEWRQSKAAGACHGMRSAGDQFSCALLVGEYRTGRAKRSNIGGPGFSAPNIAADVRSREAKLLSMGDEINQRQPVQMNR
jgi:hypothetical protein